MVRKLLPSILLISFLFSFPASAPAEAGTERLKTSGETKVGKPAPWIAGWSLDNKVINLDHLFKDGKTERVALVFFATWCKPCKRGIAMLEEAKDRIRAKGVKVVLVDIEEPPDKVKRYIKESNLTFPIMMDRFGASRKTYLGGEMGGGLPRTVVIGKDRKVIAILGQEGKDYVSCILEGLD